MSAGGGVKQHYDMLILIIVLLALLGSAGFLVFRIGSEQANLNSGAEVTTPANIRMAVVKDLGDKQEALLALKDPFQTEVKERDLMVSELRVRSVNEEQIPAPIPFDAKVCPFTGAEQPDIVAFDEDQDGIPDAKEEEYGLDPKNPADAKWDLDSDGFSNLEEHVQETDPTDATSTPSILAKIRIARTITKPFVMRFFGVQQLSEEDRRYQLNLRTLDKTYFANMGEEVEGYKLVDYVEDISTNGLQRVDRSRLTLEKDGTSIELVKGEVQNKSERILLLISLLDKKTFRVRLGESFTYREKTFEVKEMGIGGVTVFDKANGKEALVPMISEAEKQKITGKKPVSAGNP